MSWGMREMVSIRALKERVIELLLEDAPHEIIDDAVALLKAKVEAREKATKPFYQARILNEFIMGFGGELCK